MLSIKTGLLSVALSLSCVMTASAAPAVKDVLQSSFKPKGQATLERLDQDKTQQACSTGEALSGEVAAEIIADNSASVRYPADGKYLGDWRNGDKIAQTGTGLQSSDDPAKPAGGNCYACHQLADAEIAYGTIGPSLKQYGKLRGNSDAMLKYTWAKVYNAQAFMPCSTMPRFGHKNILTEQQIRDVMAFLFDAASPVNQ